MFGHRDAQKRASPLPRHCTFAENDWHILSSFWHPVIFSSEVTSKPQRARLLDVDLVVYRTEDGIGVARDLCPHRGTRLSSGCIVGRDLICPMHGLHFSADGRCTAIPSMQQPYRVPDRLRLQSCRAVEKYGMVWVCLADEPRHPMPNWDAAVEGSARPIFMPNDIWNAAAARHVENFNDLAHFPWVHGGTFGGDKKAPIPRHDVERTDFGLRFVVDYIEGANRYQDGFEGDEREVRYTYELTYPFATLLIMEPEGSAVRYYIGDVVCPESAHVSRIFQVLSDTAGMPERDFWVKDQALVNEEDRPMVEEQRPEDLPLDLTAEIHIPADRVSLEYRRGLIERFGFGAPIAA